MSWVKNKIKDWLGGRPAYDNADESYFKMRRALELASIVVTDAEDCEFEQTNPHEWYCKTHDVLKVAGTEEPVTCN